ncbi:hypothetical protein MKMG_01327 [Methanogenium sp. MK-MG]|nr:hypothetical protein MKMG_01327 [Methanogenium sp. MK-MG]
MQCDIGENILKIMSNAHRDNIKSHKKKMSAFLTCGVKGQSGKSRVFRPGMEAESLPHCDNYIYVSSRKLRQEYPATKELLCGDAFWSPSYFLATSGQVSPGVLKSYVDSQTEK